MQMEWTGHEQVVLFAESVLLGVCLGMVFAFFNVAPKCRRHRRLLFVSDMLFFMTASLVTFFFSLATMDGHLHPLLFGGSVIGFVLFHITLGRYLSRWLYLLLRCLRNGIARVSGWIFAPVRLLLLLVMRRFCAIREKRAKKAQKTRKKFAFFQKNS